MVLSYNFDPYQEDRSDHNDKRMLNDTTATWVITATVVFLFSCVSFRCYKLKWLRCNSNSNISWSIFYWLSHIDIVMTKSGPSSNCPSAILPKHSKYGNNLIISRPSNCQRLWLDLVKKVCRVVSNLQIRKNVGQPARAVKEAI